MTKALASNISPDTSNQTKNGLVRLVKSLARMDARDHHEAGIKRCTQAYSGATQEARRVQICSGYDVDTGESMIAFRYSPGCSHEDIDTEIDRVLCIDTLAGRDRTQELERWRTNLHAAISTEIVAA